MLLFSAPNTAFVDNLVDGVQGSATYGSTQGHFVCGPIPTGAIVVNNTIRNTGWEAIKFHTHGTVFESLDLDGTPARDFHISGNTIEYQYGDAIPLSNVDGARIEHNKIIPSTEAHAAKKALNPTRCANTGMVENVDE